MCIRKLYGTNEGSGIGEHLIRIELNYPICIFARQSKGNPPLICIPLIRWSFRAAEVSGDEHDLLLGIDPFDAGQTLVHVDGVSAPTPAVDVVGGEDAARDPVVGTHAQLEPGGIGKQYVRTQAHPLPLSRSPAG
jgi:hypothetical protein